MKTGIFLLLAVSLGGCAAVPPLRAVTPLFADNLFTPPAQAVRGSEVFALSPAMQSYITDQVKPRVRRRGPRFGLFEALRDDLHIDYDAAMTRNAAQTFAARSGNCLSLVILTAALAAQLDIPVTYQSVYGFDTWSRSGGLAFHSNHVNLVLGPRGIGDFARKDGDTPLTIDFLPPQDVRGQITAPIAKDTVIAMYLNNRAAEMLADGDIDAAYWSAREALRSAPAFIPAYNTLGVVYLRHGDLPQAERVLAYALAREPENAEVLSNLAKAVAAQGRTEQAQALRQRLAAIAPYPPFYFFDSGLDAMTRGDWRGAIAQFEKELTRMPYNDELHFVMAVSELRLGELKQARKQLTLALENSTARERRDIYAAKLSHLKALTIGGGH